VRKEGEGGDESRGDIQVKDQEVDPGRKKKKKGSCPAFCQGRRESSIRLKVANRSSNRGKRRGEHHQGRVKRKKGSRRGILSRKGKEENCMEGESS